MTSKLLEIALQTFMAWAAIGIVAAFFLRVRIGIAIAAYVSVLAAAPFLYVSLLIVFTFTYLQFSSDFCCSLGPQTLEYDSVTAFFPDAALVITYGAGLFLGGRFAATHNRVFPDRQVLAFLIPICISMLQAPLVLFLLACAALFVPNRHRYFTWTSGKWILMPFLGILVPAAAIIVFCPTVITPMLCIHRAG
jgi:hypothetical protein